MDIPYHIYVPFNDNICFEQETEEEEKKVLWPHADNTRNQTNLNLTLRHMKKNVRWENANTTHSTHTQSHPVTHTHTSRTPFTILFIDGMYQYYLQLFIIWIGPCDKNKILTFQHVQAHICIVRVSLWCAHEHWFDNI